MTDATQTGATSGFAPGKFVRKHRVWLVTAMILAVVNLADPRQGGETIAFVLSNIVTVAPWLLLSVVIAAAAQASDADRLIARAFTGSPLVMIGVAAAFGALSPFCSCGVIPLIAALLAMGVPLGPVMAFWLASPIIDPAMFALTAGVLGTGFALAKVVAAIVLGIAGGLVMLGLTRASWLAEPLREGVGNGGCAGAKVRAPKDPVWAFWREAERRGKFAREAGKTALFLMKWLTLAFVLESLMIAYLPADLIARAVGGTGPWPIVMGALVGVPAYLNGYAALPLVSGLMQQGMAPGAALSFLVAGGVTSIPAAVAVFALVRVRVFALYLGLSLGGAILSGLAYQLVLAL